MCEEEDERDERRTTNERSAHPMMSLYERHLYESGYAYTQSLFVWPPDFDDECIYWHYYNESKRGKRPTGREGHCCRI